MLYCNNDFEIDDSKKYKILVIEDSEFISKAVYTTLKNLEYDVYKAFTYKEAEEKLKVSDFDYIVLDLNLPDSFGEELVENIKSLTNAKIIILTSEIDKQIRETLFKIGILDYLVKDKNFSSSIKSIDTIIKSIDKNRNSTVLVIDDSAFICRQVENILKIREYEVFSALNAKDGWNLLNTKDINLVILDMEMQDIHGLDLLRQIKDEDRFCHLPVIIISGSNSPELLRDSLKLGASDFIRKPFNIEEFTLKVDLAIEFNRKHIEVLCNQKLLDEYKEAVDESSIVSKTDTKGIITFVNDKFCKISGYSKEELIGKPHNIVRHPDMPKSAFKDMWETIKDKRIWRGKVKNRRKDGGFYYVQTTITPIVDYDGNIVEYIGIRTDITDIELIKEELKNSLDISTKNFQEAYKLSKEYEKAIEDSSIVSRTDKDGTITYVNDMFCQISGYSKEELIGKKHNIVRDPKTPDKLYKKMWETITSGKTWRGQLRNRRKDGSYYYVSSTIVPILDSDDKVVEYLGIRHDVTDIVNLHTELEDTQKEIIYKMGEIGENRSQETGNHVKRVAYYSKLLALLAGLGNKNAELLYTASPMHDIGKVGIPDSILKKPGKLDEKEWEIMKTHAEIGFNILKGSTRPILRAAAVVAYRHHEKWDGTGYPNGLKGEKIHIFGRITAVADVFDALGSDRVYKKAWELERIIDLFKDEKGKHFDPKLVDIFLNNIDKFLEIRERFKD